VDDAVGRLDVGATYVAPVHKVSHVVAAGNGRRGH